MSAPGERRLTGDEGKGAGLPGCNICELKTPTLSFQIYMAAIFSVESGGGGYGRWRGKETRAVLRRGAS